MDAVAALGVPADACRVDLAIARGLDYYTGTVYETMLVANPEVGSICSGGRYDDLASNYAKQPLPGVGISIGLTRLLHRLFELGVVRTSGSTPAQVLVTLLDPAGLAQALSMASELRGHDIRTELFTEGKKLGAQLKYASQRGHRLALIVGEDEAAKNEVTIKDLARESQQTVARGALVGVVQGLLTGAEPS
jgi:histidyl-tRNA synthetase